MTPRSGGTSLGRRVVVAWTIAAVVSGFVGCQPRIRGAGIPTTSAPPEPPYCEGEKLTNVPFADGAGTADDPYRICTALQFLSIRDSESAHFLLKADINLAGSGFTTMDSFEGVLDGGSKKILGLITPLIEMLVAGAVVRNLVLENVAIARTSQDTGAVASWVYGNPPAAVIQNVTLTGSVSGGGNTGGLVGFCDGPLEIRSSHVTATIASTWNQVGGLLGSTIKDLTISDSSFTGAINAEEISRDVGGLVGGIFSPTATITDSTATVTISTAYYTVGGIVGNASAYSSMQASGLRVSGTIAARGMNVGGIFGLLYYGPGTHTIDDCRFSGTLEGGNDGHWSAYGTGGLIGQLSGSASGDLEISNSRASGTITSYASAGGLIGASYVGYPVAISGAVNSTVVTSLSDSAGGLIGELGGGPLSITDSSSTGAVSADGSSAGGLIGGAYGEYLIQSSHSTGRVKANASGTGWGMSAGGLVGNSGSGAVKNSYATGQVSADMGAGGLVGSVYGNFSAERSYASGAVSADDHAGGVIGEIWSATTISYCYATGHVTGNGSIGGFLGVVEATSYVMQSYATGNVAGSNSVGGFAGHSNRAEYYNVYARGNVSGLTSGPGPVGGLVGAIFQGWVYHSYSTGAVTAPDLAPGWNPVDYSIGGLVGYDNSGWACQWGHSFWDIETSGIAVNGCSEGDPVPGSLSGATDGAVGKTTAQMQMVATYTDPDLVADPWDASSWFSTDPWFFDADGNPVVPWILQAGSYPALAF